MTTRKVLASILAASMLQPPPTATVKEASDGTVITDLAPDKQAELMGEAVELLQKLKHREIDPRRYQTIVWDLAARHQPTTNQEVKLKHVYKYFRDCNGRFNFVDNWSRRWTDYENMPKVQRDDLELEDAWDDIITKTNEITVKAPHISFDRAFLEAARSIKPENYLHNAKYWKEFNYYRGFSETDTQEAMLRSLTTYGFPIFHPEKALAELRAGEGTPTWKLPTRIWSLRSLKNQIHTMRKVESKVREVAAKTSVPAEDLALLVGGFYDIDSQPKTAVRRTQEPKREQKQPFAIDVERLAIGLLPHIRRMYEDGTEAVIIADREARPMGKILEYIIEEFGLPRIPVRYFKFGNKEKFAERYAHCTKDISSAERRDLTENMMLRKQIRQCIESEDSKRHIYARTVLGPKLQQSIDHHRELYDRLSAPVLREQEQAAIKELGDLSHRKVKIFDTWVLSGNTKENILDTLAKAKIYAEATDIITTVDTPQNASRQAIYRDLCALLNEHHQWKKSLPWHQYIGAVGVEYGIDRPAPEQGKLFRRYRALKGIALRQPENTYYSTAEITAIKNEVLSSTMLDKSTGPILEKVGSKITETLQRYRTKECHEAIEQRLNIIRSNGFHQGLRYGVQSLHKKLRAIYSSEALKNYLTARHTGLPEYQVSSTIQDVVAELHTI